MRVRSSAAPACAFVAGENAAMWMHFGRASSRKHAPTMDTYGVMHGPCPQSQSPHTFRPSLSIPHGTPFPSHSTLKNRARTHLLRRLRVITWTRLRRSRPRCLAHGPQKPGALEPQTTNPASHLRQPEERIFIQARLTPFRARPGSPRKENIPFVGLSGTIFHFWCPVPV